MKIGVVAGCMFAGYDLGKDIWQFFHILPYTEKSRFGIVTVKYCEDFSGKLPGGAVVKCEINNLFTGLYPPVKPAG